MDMPTDLKLAPRENPPSRRPVAAILLIALVAFGLAMPSSAEVERLEITKRRPSPGFAAGLAGPYEFLRGTAHFAVDPAAPENARVVDLDKAERDPDGKVRFTASFYLFQPVDPTRGNGALIVDVPNRGRPLALLFNFPDSTLRPPSGPLGDGFLERHGFAAAGVGWQSDAPELPSAAVASGALLLQRDLVPAGGVEGLARGVGVFSRDGETRLELGHWKHRPILAAAPDDPRNVLTVRDRLDGERRVVPRERWRFSPERDAVLLEDGFEKGKVYEVVYVARDSDIAGLGFVATRDFAAYLVHSPDSPAKVRRTLAFGGSQTARCLHRQSRAGPRSRPRSVRRPPDRWNGRRDAGGVFSGG